jgi:hypothetical protein
MLELHEAVIREFLNEHPEHIQGVRRLPDPKRGGQMELMLDTDTMIAFTDWTIATGRGNAKKARAFREAIRERYGR